VELGSAARKSLSVKQAGRLFDQFAQDRRQELKFTRRGPACGNCSSCVLDDLNQTSQALDEGFANRPMIQIVQFDVQTDLPRL
jgi:hypothetical protein